MIVNTSVDHECFTSDMVLIFPLELFYQEMLKLEKNLIGANSVIKEGVEIGDNVIIGAGSVVIKNVDNNKIVYGNPANNKVIVIAEAGVNHNGNLKIAKKLIDAASNSGADYVKFQTFKAEKLVSKHAEKAEYQKRNFKDNDETQFNMLKQLKLLENDHYELINYCNLKKIKFFSTAFDLDALDFLNSLDLDFFKIPSGEINNYALFEKNFFFW